MGTIQINNQDYPFELTARGRLNIEGSKVDLNKVAVNELEALRFAYEVCKGACKHFEMAFTFDFNAFVDKVEPTVFIKARQLAVLLLTPEVFGKAVQKNESEKKNNLKISNDGKKDND